MSDDNPYQSPQCYGPAEDSAPVAGAGEGVWRQGDLLVMRKDGVLPDRCVFSNEPADGIRVRRTYHWRPRLLYLISFLSLGIGYLLLDPFFGRTIVVDVPTSPEWYAERRRRVRIAWTLGIVALCMILPGVGLGIFDCIPAGLIPVAKGWMMVGWGLLVIGAFIEASAPRVRLSVTHVQGDYFWIRGMNSRFLAGLPRWPGA